MNPNRDEIDWITDPQSLVGERIQVVWKEGKRYGGKVTKYSPASKIFTVLYDDGEEKFYDLFDKSFRVDGESSDWTPALSRPLRDMKSAPVSATAATVTTSVQNPLYSAGGRSHTSTSAPATNIYGNTGYGTGYGSYNTYQNHPPARYKPRQRVQYVTK
jgi:hypothetical protein